MDTEKNYYVSVKLYSEPNVNKSYRAHDLYEVSESSHLYRPFRPKTLDFNPKQKFGVIRGDQFLLLQLLKMAETREDLELGRTIVGKRLSIGNEIIPLKRLKLVEESDAIKESMTSTSQKKKKNDRYENDSKMLKKLAGSNSKHGEKSKKKKRRSKSRDERLNVNDGFDRNNQNENNSDSKSKEKSESDDDATWDPANGTKDHDNVSISANGTAFIDNIEERDKENSDQMKQCTVSNTVKSGTGINNKNDSCTDGTAHTGDKSLNDSTQNGCKRCLQLEEENNLLKKQLESAQLTGNNVLSELKEQISKVPELVRVFSLEKQFLKDDKFIVSLEDNMKNIQVGEDEIYCGNGIVVKKFDIYDVPEETTFGRRVNKLCDIFWKDKTYCHFLSGKCVRAPQDMVIYKITDNEIKAMKRILKKMSWEGVPCGSTDLSGHSIREVVKHYTSDCLTRKLGGKKRPKQQQKQQLRKKKMSSDSSDEGSLIQKANKKKRARKTAMSELENSSTSESGSGSEN